MSGKLRIGIHKGDGPPPGYKWNVLFVSFVSQEAMRFLNASQYEHLAEQFWLLATQDDPTRSLVVSVDAIEDFHELRDKGGVLGRVNVRVFYYVDYSRRAIVVIGACEKKNDGPTLQVVKVRMRGRVKSYLRGEYGAINVKSKQVDDAAGEDKLGR